MLILGIDPGMANTGWSLVDKFGALDSFEHVETGRRPGTGDAQRRLSVVLRALVAPMRKAVAVVVEWPGLGGSPRPGAMGTKAASQTAAVASAAIGLAVGMGGARKILLPSPVTWRRRLGSKDQSDEVLHAALLVRYPLLADLRKKAQPHCLDSLGLALYGRLVLHPNLRTDRNQETATP